MPILVVSSIKKDHLVLSRTLRDSLWRLKLADSYEDARDSIRHRAVEVVLCASVLLDGGWKDVLRETVRLPVPPPVVVLSDFGGRAILREVLGYGGHDVLTRPLKPAAVLSTVRLAWLAWNLRCARYQAEKKGVRKAINHQVPETVVARQ